jgi:hypothetical protein
MNLRQLVLLPLLLSALAPPNPARALDVVDDWRKVGPVEDRDPPSTRATLSPRAAAGLVAAVELADRSGSPLRARTDGLEWAVENLVQAFHATDDAPATSGTSEEPRDSRREVTRRIDVVGTRAFGAHRVLVAEARVFWDEPGGDFTPASLAFVFDGKGKVTDVAVLRWSVGDACYAAGRTFRTSRNGFLVKELR